METHLTTGPTFKSIQSFEGLFSPPSIVGTIDGSHVNIKAPPDNAVDYLSQYQQHR